MNIAVEEISKCRRRVNIEVPADVVNKELVEITKDYQNIAKVPGFRPGKAPQAVVEKKYAEDIQDELRRRLVPKAFREAVKQKSLKVVNLPQIEDLRYEKGLSLSFSTTVDVAPEFAVPDYKNFKLKDVDQAVEAKDVDQTIDYLLGQHAKYEPVTGRAVKKDDYAIISFTATIDGKSLGEINPKFKGLDANENYWAFVNEDSFLSELNTQLEGLNIGNKKDLNVKFADKFSVPELAGQTAQYHVEVKEIRERILPELNDELAKKIAGLDSVTELKQRVEENLKAQKQMQARREQAAELMEQLKNSTNFDLPESTVTEETQNLIYQMVEDNHRRGVPNEEMEKAKDEILSNATTSAKDKVKIGFILEKIAEAEKIEVTPQEMQSELEHMAQHYKMPMNKLIEKLNENYALTKVEKDILQRKTIEHLITSKSK